MQTFVSNFGAFCENYDTFLAENQNQQPTANFRQVYATSNN
jgi:hypothetical protein